MPMENEWINEVRIKKHRAYNNNKITQSAKNLLNTSTKKNKCTIYNLPPQQDPNDTKNSPLPPGAPTNKNKGKPPSPYIDPISYFSQPTFPRTQT